MNKIMICMAAGILSAGLCTASFALNDMGSAEKWLEDASPAIHTALHRKKGHEHPHKDGKSGKHDKSDKRNKSDKHDKSEKHDKRDKHDLRNSHERAENDRHHRNGKAEERHEKIDRHEEYGHSREDRHEPQEKPLHETDDLKVPEAETPANETGEASPFAAPAPPADGDA